LALLLFGFVGTTFRQNQLLREARTTAEARQEQAEGLFGYMLDDLRPKLEAIGQTDLLMEAAERAEDYFTAVPPDQLSDMELSRRTEQIRFLGDVRMRQGDLIGALASFQDAHLLSQGLLERDSTNADWRFGLAMDHSWLGNISFQRGDLDQALAHFVASRDHLQRLVAEQ